MSDTEKTIQKTSHVVGFDLDGVIIDHSENKLVLARHFGVLVAPEHTHSEQLPKLMPPEAYLEFQNELYGDSDFALGAPLMTGAKDVLQLLRARQIPFVLISRRKRPAHAIELLRRRGLWGDYFTEQNAFFVGVPEEKNHVAIREGVTHFFDDERRVLRKMPAVRSRFLFDTFDQFDEDREFVRVFDWSMVKELFVD